MTWLKYAPHNANKIRNYCYIILIKFIVMTTYSPIAQLVEQRTVNPCVPGSSPGWRAIY